MPSTDSLQTALTRIGEFRKQNTRESAQVFQDGLRILEAGEGKLLKNGDDGEFVLSPASMKGTEDYQCISVAPPGTAVSFSY